MIKKVKVYQSCTDNILFYSGFLRSIVVTDECDTQVSGFAKPKPLVFMALEPESNSRNELQSKRVAVWYAVHGNLEVGPYHSNNETGRAVDHYKFLDNYALWKAQQVG